MRKIILLCSIAFSLAACQQNKGWTKAEKDAFTTTCESKTQSEAEFSAEKAKSYCSCMLQKLEAKYKTADEADAKSSDTEMTAMARECLK